MLRLQQHLRRIQFCLSILLLLCVNVQSREVDISTHLAGRDHFDDSSVHAAAASVKAEAPAAPAPAQVNLTALMARKGCAAFAGLLAANADAEQTFAGNVDGGLTAFCPLDEAVKPFLPKFKNLTADGKLSLLLYHAIPVYYSLQMLQTGNGVVNTLATDGTARNYNLTVQNDGEQVTLRTRVTVATIKETLLDKDPVAVYAIDEVLQPAELFKPAEPPTPAPAPASTEKSAAAPKAGKKASPPAPGGPEEQPADQKAADKSAAIGINGAYRSIAAVLAAAITAMVEATMMA